MAPPPHNLEAERDLLGTMLLSRDAIAAALDVCGSADFYKPGHGSIFEAIAALHARGETVAPTIIRDEAARNGDDVLTEDLVSLIADAPATGSARRLAEIVAEKAACRRGMAEASAVVEALGSGDLAALGDGIGRLEAIRNATGPRTRRYMADGASFVLDGSVELVPVWGRGDDVPWAAGEPLLIGGPPGVGKTTLALQLVAGRLGIVDEVLGYPVAPGRRLLYLALDRPRQIERAMRRLFGEEHRDLLAERLVVWKGPLPADIGKVPTTLLELAQDAGADTVVTDSLKDAASKLADDEVGGNVNRAHQHLVANGIEALSLHHQRKGQGGAKPTSLEDVYGSTWLTAGAGSVLLLWGAAGDPIVELRHLKQPAGEIGPLKVEHDHLTGRSTVYRGQIDTLRVLRNGGARGVTSVEIARLMFECEKPSDNQRKKAQRQLDRLVNDGHAKKEDHVRAGDGGVQPARYYPIDNHHGDQP